MEFKYKSQKEVNELTDEQVEVYAKELKAHEAEMNKKAISEAVESAKKEIKEQHEAEVKELQKHLDALDVKLQSKGMNKKEVSLAEEIKEKSLDIKSVALGNKSGDVEVKALTTRASVGDSAQGFFIPEITQLGHKERTLYNILPKITISDNNTSGLVRYNDWDEATTVRAAAMVAEGATFPEATAKFQWYSKELRKVGDTLPVTEEFFEDEALAASELSMFLDTNVNLKIDDQLINGDNTGQNLDGIYNSAPAYTAVASGIAGANLKDLTIKMRNDITRSRGSKYSPDMVLTNSLTMESLILAKDQNNNYIFDENTGTLGGMFVAVDENMPDNAILVGDRKYARIYEKTGVVISRGRPNSQFLDDEMTIKARKRMLLLIKNGDKIGFRKVTDVATALETLATTPA